MDFQITHDNDVQVKQIFPEAKNVAVGGIYASDTGSYILAFLKNKKVISGIGLKCF